MWSEAQEVLCERENSVEMNEFKSWKLIEIGLKMRALETRTLEDFFLWINLFFQNISQNQKIRFFLCPLQMNYIYRQVINIIREVNQGIRRVIKYKKSKYTHFKKVKSFRI